MRRRRRGFTLIELLLVVTIIGVLASIAIPGFRATVIRARRVDFDTKFYQYRKAIEHYAEQNGHLPPADPNYSLCAEPPMGSAPNLIAPGFNPASPYFVGNDIQSRPGWYDTVEPWRTLTAFGAPMFDHSRDRFILLANPAVVGTGAAALYLYGFHNFDWDAILGAHVVFFQPDTTSPVGYKEEDFGDAAPNE